MGYNLANYSMSSENLCIWCNQRPAVIFPYLFSKRGFCCEKHQYEYDQAHKS